MLRQLDIMAALLTRAARNRPCDGRARACARWPIKLSRLAQETGLDIQVCHFPPGTSKWNKIEHRLFSFITMNWRGRPLISHEIIVSLIANPKTRSGLKLRAELDSANYPKGLTVSDKDFAAIKIDRNELHGDWNHRIRSG